MLDNLDAPEFVVLCASCCLSTSREVLVPAIWKVKQIQKWEIDSIQAVLDEENETQLGTFDSGQALTSFKRR